MLSIDVENEVEEDPTVSRPLPVPDCVSPGTARKIAVLRERRYRMRQGMQVRYRPSADEVRLESPNPVEDAATENPGLQGSREAILPASPPSSSSSPCPIHHFNLSSLILIILITNISTFLITSCILSVGGQGSFINTTTAIITEAPTDDIIITSSESENWPGELNLISIVGIWKGI